MKKRVIFRADGNSEIGLGHLVRSTALAAMLSKDFELVFAVHNTNPAAIKIIRSVSENIIDLGTADAEEFSGSVSPADIVVLDGYAFDTAYQQKLKSKGCSLVCIDDIHSFHFVADIIINQSSSVKPRDYSAESYTKFCLGFDYALLRQSFLKRNPVKGVAGKVESALISMGGADSNNISYKVAEGLSKLGIFKTINILTTGANANLASLLELSSRTGTVKVHTDLPEKEVCELMVASDVAYCPASSVSVECCALGIPMLAGYTADNQLGILKSLKAEACCEDIGDWKAVTLTDLLQRTREMISDPGKMNRMVEHQRKLVDGRSGERFLQLFKSLADA